MSSVRPPATETPAQNASLRTLIGKYMYDAAFASGMHQNNRDARTLTAWLTRQGHDIDATAINYLVGKTSTQVVSDTGLNLQGTLPNGTY